MTNWNDYVLNSKLEERLAEVFEDVEKAKTYTDEKFQEVDIYGVHARLDAFNDAFNQYDISLNDITNTLGDIDIALDSIIAMQNELTGGGEA
jgi:archaellum component FlaC